MYKILCICILAQIWECSYVGLVQQHPCTL
nr:MAG TPA: hypothetical protein [Caudoviricetes sp.]DAX00115.1 MAG TPA: hypothetical protein [Bacteriophage sp.]